MSGLDLGCLAIVTLAAVAGALTGALAQLASTGATAAGWAGARWLAPAVAPLLQGRVPAFAAHPVASVLTFAGCATVAALSLRALGAAARARGALGGRVDRAVGALLGGAKAALVLWVLLSALALWGRAVHVGPVHLDPRGSELVAAARERSALGRHAGTAAAAPAVTPRRGHDPHAP
jgi:membrane protein required for colicin V production